MRGVDRANQHMVLQLGKAIGGGRECSECLCVVVNL